MTFARRSFLLGCLVAVSMVVIAVWRSVQVSLEAEKTLGGYLLVLDALTIYVSENTGQWPQSWEDLATASPREEYAGWSWPRDIREIRKRIWIDFSTSAHELASASPEQFTAVKQIGPNYGPREGKINVLLQAIRESRDKNGQ